MLIHGYRANRLREKNTTEAAIVLTRSRNGAVKDTTQEYFSEIIKERTKERSGNAKVSARQTSKKKEYEELCCKIYYSFNSLTEWGLKFDNTDAPEAR